MLVEREQDMEWHNRQATSCGGHGRRMPDRHTETQSRTHTSPTLPDSECVGLLVGERSASVSVAPRRVHTHTHTHTHRLVIMLPLCVYTSPRAGPRTSNHLSSLWHTLAVQDTLFHTLTHMYVCTHGSGSERKDGQFSSWLRGSHYYQTRHATPMETDSLKRPLISSNGEMPGTGNGHTATQLNVR